MGVSGIRKVYCSVCGAPIYPTDEVGDGEDLAIYSMSREVGIGLYDDEAGAYWPVCVECLEEHSIEDIWDSIESQLSDGTLTQSDDYYKALYGPLYEVLY